MRGAHRVRRRSASRFLFMQPEVIARRAGRRPRRPGGRCAQRSRRRRHGRAAPARARGRGPAPWRGARSRSPPRPRFASSTPRASSAASAADSVQPVPCVERDRSRGARNTVTLAAAIDQHVDHLVAAGVAAGDEDGGAAGCELARGRAPRLVARRRPRDRAAPPASPRFGVSTVTRGSEVDRQDARGPPGRAAACRPRRAAPDREPRAPRPVDRRRGERATRVTVAALPSMPILMPSTPMSSSTARSWRSTELRRERLDREHARGRLRGDRGHHRHAVDVVRGKGLEVGLDAGAAARIGAGDREQARRAAAVIALDRAPAGARSRARGRGAGPQQRDHDQDGEAHRLGQR